MQSELHAAVNAAVKPDPASVEALKRSAAEKRAALLAAQEALHAGVAAAHGPQGRSGAHGGSGSPPGDAGQDDMDNNAYDDGEDSNSNDSKDDADDEKDHEEGSSGGGDGYTAHSRRRRARRLRHTRRLLEDAAAHHRKARRASKDNVTLALPLGPAFVKCANKAQATCARRRKSSMASLKMPDGRTPTFSKAARKKIPQDVIDFIR